MYSEISSGSLYFVDFISYCLLTQLQIQNVRLLKNIYIYKYLLIEYLCVGPHKIFTYTTAITEKYWCKTSFNYVFSFLFKFIIRDLKCSRINHMNTAQQTSTKRSEPALISLAAVCSTTASQRRWAQQTITRENSCCANSLKGNYLCCMAFILFLCALKNVPTETQFKFIGCLIHEHACVYFSALWNLKSTFRTLAPGV